MKRATVFALVALAVVLSTNARARDGGALLVRSLRLDALASGAMGVLLAAGGWLLDGPLGAPAAFLVPLGVFLVAYAALLWAIARDAFALVQAAAVVVFVELQWIGLRRAR